MAEMEDPPPWRLHSDDLSHVALIQSDSHFLVNVLPNDSPVPLVFRIARNFDGQITGGRSWISLPLNAPSVPQFASRRDLDSHIPCFCPKYKGATLEGNLPGNLDLSLYVGASTRRWRPGWWRRWWWWWWWWWRPRWWWLRVRVRGLPRTMQTAFFDLLICSVDARREICDVRIAWVFVRMPRSNEVTPGTVDFKI